MRGTSEYKHLIELFLIDSVKLFNIIKTRGTKEKKELLIFQLSPKKHNNERKRVCIPYPSGEDNEEEYLQEDL